MVRADVIEQPAAFPQQTRRRKRGQELDGRVDNFHGAAEIGYSLLVKLVTELVADLPVTHVVRLGMTIGRTQLAHRRLGLSVEVLDLARRIARRLARESHADERLGAGPLAELDKFLEASVSRLESAPNGGKRRPPRGVANRVLPVETLGCSTRRSG